MTTTISGILTRIEDLQSRISNVKRAVDTFVFELGHVEQGRSALALFEKRKDAIQRQIAEIIALARKLDPYFWQYQMIDARSFDKYLMDMHEVCHRVWVAEKMKNAATPPANKRLKRFKYESEESAAREFVDIDRVLNEAASSTKLKIERIYHPNEGGWSDLKLAAMDGAMKSQGALSADSKPTGTPSRLVASMPGLFVAHVVFGRSADGLVVDRIVVHGAEESSTLNSAALRTAAATDAVLSLPTTAASGESNVSAPIAKSPWESSGFLVFQKVSEHAARAVQQYWRDSATSDEALQRLLVWLNSFHDLFTAACKGCGRILSHDSQRGQFLPPCFRTFDELHPYHCHIQCHPL